VIVSVDPALVSSNNGNWGGSGLHQAPNAWRSISISVLPDRTKVDASPWELQIIDSGGMPLQPSLKPLRPWSSREVMGTIEFAMGDQSAHPFVDQVTEDVAPTYLQYIPAPMCLRLVLERLRSGYYRQSRAVKGDLRLIQDNCHEFNGPTAEISRMSDNLVSRLLGAVQ